VIQQANGHPGLPVCGPLTQLELQSASPPFSTTATFRRKDFFLDESSSSVTR
jgi:hypothetical protein